MIIKWVYLLVGVVVGACFGCMVIFFLQKKRVKESYDKGFSDAGSVKLSATKILHERRFIPTKIEACAEISKIYFESDADYTMNMVKDMLGRDLGVQAINFATIRQEDDLCTGKKLIKASIYIGAKMEVEE